MPIPKPNQSETEEQYVSRCIGEIYDEYGQEQGAAICYNTYRKSEGMSGERLVASKIKQMSKYRGIYLAEGLENACWEGYEAIGTKGGTSMRQRNEFVFMSVSQHIYRRTCVDNLVRHLIFQVKSSKQADVGCEPGARL